MIIFKRAGELRSHLDKMRYKGLKTGFVPTMGALHEGHLSLVQASQKGNELTLCSIFVNPTQFNDPKDFEKYPVRTENDIYLLERADCDILFLPPVNEIYPNGMDSGTHYALGNLENILEGRYRPGHFQGVCQVMERLLNIVNPDCLYLGQKDYQQCMVLKKMVKLIQLPVQIEICPTLREADGLAMSSRNLRLNVQEREKASGIFKALEFISQNIQPGDTNHILYDAQFMLSQDGFKVDYVAICKAGDLELVNHWDGKTPLVALAAAFLNQVRLIDNLLL
jgi:pantoate--beta-alanine ligase